MTIPIEVHLRERIVVSLSKDQLLLDGSNLVKEEGWSQEQEDGERFVTNEAH